MLNEDQLKQFINSLLNKQQMNEQSVLNKTMKPSLTIQFEQKHNYLFYILGYIKAQLYTTLFSIKLWSFDVMQIYFISYVTAFISVNC